MVGVPEDPATEQGLHGPGDAGGQRVGPGPHRRAADPRCGARRPRRQPRTPTISAAYASALAEIDATDGAVLVAELDGEVVGVCQLIVFRHLQRRGGRCAEIESVHVHPEHRGSGIGGALLR